MMIERRAVPRYPLSLPIRVKLVEPNSHTYQTGRTRDISTQGTYFVVQSEFYPGEALDFALTLTADLSGDGLVCVRGTGHVARLEEKGAEGYGIAATIRRYEISRAKTEPTFS